MTRFSGRYNDPPWRRESRKPAPANPRRVRNGLKLAIADAHFEGHHAARAWIEPIERAGAHALVEGTEYARLGQTRRMSVSPGLVEGAVQGRADRAYATSISLTVFTDDQWRRIVALLADQARYSARLLASELPPDIEEPFQRLGLHLFPSDADPARPACNCGHEDLWCKHAICLALLVAERLVHDPLLIFTLRGLPESELLDRLRDLRALSAAGGRSVPMYRPAVPGASDYQAPPLEESLQTFWDTPEDLDALDYRPTPPEVPHPLLRRLGPSPWPQGKFPLVGLLATCYEIVTEFQLRHVDSGRGESTLPPDRGADGDGRDPGNPPE